MMTKHSSSVSHLSRVQMRQQIRPCDIFAPPPLAAAGCCTPLRPTFLLLLRPSLLLGPALLPLLRLLRPATWDGERVARHGAQHGRRSVGRGAGVNGGAAES
ncbi:hypothetical protein PR202_gb00574 [Eleusine coracana subsp. coracana]|uniref:Uncharacterized protein n=1 Tax=Eleusine coracana subsp. coracana TaxID=191504 RepID=A0AAV5DUM8_ELECO|nr:hypothetical protein PR202_gb00574 [Eleusine coracana subsp. coracana]